ncbi:MAG: hypothetical protein IRY85_05540 [Micromonosporaceae bacterium]|nr:hypothetical protein [Micromonosporaceae bacterium]
MSAAPNGPHTDARWLGVGLRVLVYAFLLAICGVPAAALLFTEGDVRWGVIIGAAALLALTVLIGFTVIVIKSVRLVRASGALAAARREQAELDRRHALAGPPPVAVRIAAAVMFLTGAVLAAGAIGTVVQGIRLASWALVVALPFAAVLASLGFVEYLSGRALLRRGDPTVGQVLHGLLATIFALGIINGLVSDSPDKWIAILALVGTSTFLALPALLVQTPATKAWVKRHKPTVADANPSPAP